MKPKENLFLCLSFQNSISYLLPNIFSCVPNNEQIDKTNTRLYFWYPEYNSRRVNSMQHLLVHKKDALFIGVKISVKCLKHLHLFLPPFLCHIVLLHHLFLQQTLCSLCSYERSCQDHAMMNAFFHFSEVVSHFHLHF